MKEQFLSDIPLSMAVQAYGGVSFNPERRGAIARQDYAIMLAEDLKAFEAAAERGNSAELLPEEFERYRAGLRSRYLAYLQSNARCISSFIAGPSNFPVARAQKRSAISDRRLGDLFQWREVAKRAVLRKLRPDLRPIMAGDADAADRLAAKIALAEQRQAQMKAANAAIRAAAKGGSDAQIAALMELGYDEAYARVLVFPRESYRRQGFEAYELSNNNANIRRMKERLEQIERQQGEQLRMVDSDNGIKLEDDPPANRVRLFFPGKPDESVRSRLKANGFRWAPSIGAWQAYRNYRAIQVANDLAGVAA